MIGKALTALPEPTKDPDERRSSNLTQQLLQTRRIIQHFWKQWRLGYLSTLQERSKWYRSQQTFKEGDIVIVKEDNVPVTVWPLAKVEKLFHGNDNIVRVVQIKTAKGHYIRPVTKLILLLHVE